MLTYIYPTVTHAHNVRMCRCYHIPSVLTYACEHKGYSSKIIPSGTCDRWDWIPVCLFWVSFSWSLVLYFCPVVSGSSFGAQHTNVSIYSLPWPQTSHNPLLHRVTLLVRNTVVLWCPRANSYFLAECREALGSGFGLIGQCQDYSMFSRTCQSFESLNHDLGWNPDF